MIVLITSWAPVLARSAPGIPPQIAPPIVPAMRISGMATMPGRSVIHESAPTQAAVTPPANNCPSAPMLNSPARKAKASASAEPIKGTDRATDPASSSPPPTMPRSSAQ